MLWNVLLRAMRFSVVAVAAILSCAVLSQESGRTEDRVSRKILEIAVQYPLDIQTEEAVRALAGFAKDNTNIIVKASLPYAGTGTDLQVKTAIFLLENSLSPALLRVQEPIIVALSFLGKSCLEQDNNEAKVEIKRLALDNDAAGLLRVLGGVTRQRAERRLAFEGLCEIAQRSPAALIDILENGNAQEDDITCLSLALATRGEVAAGLVKSRIRSYVEKKNTPAKGLIRALAFFASRDHFQTFVDLLSNDELVCECADALAISGNPKAFLPLKDRLANSSPVAQERVIRALSYCLSAQSGFSFGPYIESKTSLTRYQAILSAARTKDTTSVRSIAQVMRERGENWKIRCQAVEAYAAIAPEKAWSDVLKLYAKERLQRKDIDYLERSRLRSSIISALIFCWKDDLYSEVLKHVESRVDPDTTELSIYYGIMQNTREELWLEPLVKAYIRNLSNKRARHDIAYLTALFEKKRHSGLFHLILLLDPSQDIREVAYSSLPRFVKEKSLKDYQPNLPPAETKDRVLKALMDFKQMQGFLYYSQVEGLANWHTEIDEEAVKKGISIDPYAREPLTKEQIEELHKEEAEFEKLLADLCKKQEEAWKKQEQPSEEKQEEEKK